MSKSGSRLGMMIVALVWAGWIAFTGVSSADLDIQKQAKAAGVDVKNCQSCHTAALPKKDSHDLNDAGKWLVAEKDKRGAAKVDGAWLKDYPGKK
jgi:mono/diheme cytochrome c family protein